MLIGVVAIQSDYNQIKFHEKSELRANGRGRVKVLKIKTECT